MLEREKVCSSAAITTALADLSGNQICSDGDGIPSSLQLSSDRYACNPDNVYAVPKADLQEIEWIEPDSVDAEVSRLVAGSSTTTTTTTTTLQNNPRRCCRTSTSSGYSSHSPPLSAGSYSYYASAIPGQGSFRASAPLTMRDQYGGGLAVIHEGEAIPRPIWPSAFASREFCHGDDGNLEYGDGLYTCCGCGCAYAYSYCDWDYGQPSNATAREVLLELSRTLNSVIEGETTMSPEEILHNISHTVAQGISLKRGGVYEYAYHNSGITGSTSASLPNSRNPPDCNKNPPSRVNPVNSKVYGNSRYSNSFWPTSRCTCNHKVFNSLKGEGNAVTGEGKKEVTPAVFLIHDHHLGALGTALHCHRTPGSRGCKCFFGHQASSSQTSNACGNRQIGVNGKQSMGQSRGGHGTGEPEYTMQLECSDGGSSSEGMVVVPPAKSDWNHRIGGFMGELDFTLDVSRAERLGRAIAKAKRKRQWCRALTALFGLVFFVLSVVVVSLSVTRGRKVFGSM